MKFHIFKGLNSYFYVVLCQEENEKIHILDNVDQNTTCVVVSKGTYDVCLKLNFLTRSTHSNRFNKVHLKTKLLPWQGHFLAQLIKKIDSIQFKNLFFCAWREANLGLSTLKGYWIMCLQNALHRWGELRCNLTWVGTHRICFS